MQRSLSPNQTIEQKEDSQQNIKNRLLTEEGKVVTCRMTNRRQGKKGSNNKKDIRQNTQMS